MFDDIIADIISKKKIQPIVTKLFIRGPKIKDVRVSSTHYFIMKIIKRRELQEIAAHHSLDLDFEEFKKIYGRCTLKSYFSE